MKQTVYWIGFFAALALTAVITLGKLLPVQGISVFFFALSWLWAGTSILFGLDTPYFKPWSPGGRRGSGLLLLGLGAVWFWASLTPLADLFWPLLLMSAPFLLLMFLLSRKEKRSRAKTGRE